MDQDEPPAYEIDQTSNLITTISQLSYHDISPSEPSSPDDQGPPELLIDEELPSYEPANVPIYEEPPSNDALVTFTIRQCSRKLRLVEPAPDCPSFPTYLITTRSGPRLFSGKPDYTLTRLVDTSSRTSSVASAVSTSSSSSSVLNLSTLASQASQSPQSKKKNHKRKRNVAAEIAHMNFTSGTSFPWMPRARITHLRNPLIAPRTLDLAAPNFADFQSTLHGKPLAWKLSDHPSTCLVLVERGHRHVTGDRIIARFVYGALGTDAGRGQEVGSLEVYEIPELESSSDEDESNGRNRGRSVDELEWLELVIAGADLVVEHWQAMGKHFRNNVRPSRCHMYGISGPPPGIGRGRWVGGFGAYGYLS